MFDLNANRSKVAGAVVVLCATCFAFGRYSVSQQASSGKTTDTVAVQSDVNKDKDIKTHTQTTETKKPDGTVTIVTVTDQNSQAKTEAKTDTQEQEQTVVTAPPPRKTLNVSAIIATQLTTLTPLYGVSVSKEVLGPVTVGAFGLTNGTVGVTVGLDF